VTDVPWPLASVPETAEQVWAASYPDFVAMINQTNVMPGALATVSTWALHSRLNTASTVLDVACTTGFASRELARLSGCSAVGFDLSADAVALARYNHATAAPGLDLSYVQADGTSFNPGRRFTHIAVGAALGFFPDPPAMARRLAGFLADGGCMLAAPFWCDDAGFPDDLAAIRRDVFGISSPAETREQALDLFRGLDVLYQEDHMLHPETGHQISHYCCSTIDRACQQAGIRDPGVRLAMIGRLRQVKEASNRLRPFQHYTVLVLRLDAAAYPHRYVELF
jgi:SAM-dependent methyltransferase